MTDLPRGWTWIKLDDVVLSVKNGIFVSRPGAEPDGVPILRISAVRPGALDLADIRYTGLDPFAVREAGSEIRPGDLLFTRYNGNLDYVGACAVVPNGVGVITYPDKLIRVRVKSEIADPKYICYAFQAPSIRAEIRRLARTTAGQAGISNASLRQVLLPLPPLAEQRRIVAILEDHLSIIQTNQQSVERAVRRTRALQRSILAKVDAELEGEQDLEICELLADPLRNGHSAPAAVGGSGIRVVTLTAVTKAQFVEKHTKLTDADPVRVKDLWLLPGDILVQRSNTPELVGTAALYEGPPNWAIFPDLLIRLRVKANALPKFVTYMLSTPRIRHYLRSSAKGLAGSMPKIDQATIAATKIRIPTLDRQVQIVKQLDESMLAIRRLEDACGMILRKSSNLRFALLRNAFSGRLMMQDPGDEPVSDLLARLKRENEGRQFGKKRLGAAPKHTTDLDVHVYEQGELPL